MKEDRLMEDLARLAREGPDDPDEALLEALCLGTLDAASREALERRAADDPALAAWIEAYRPMVAEDRPEFVAVAERALAEKTPVGTSGDDVVDHANEVHTDGDIESANRRGGVVVPMRRRTWWPLAAAAAVALLWLAWPRPTLGPLPAYTLDIVGGTKAVRSGQPAPEVEGPLRVAAGDRVTFVLRPATEVEGTAAARAFIDRDGTPVPLATPVEIAETGAGRLVLDVGDDIAADPGRRTVWIAVGRPNALPTAAQVTAQRGADRPSAGSAAGWHLFETQLEVAAGPGGGP